MSELPPYDVLMLQARAVAAEVRAEERPAPRPHDVRARNALVMAGGAALLGGYGAAQWWRDGFTRDFRVVREGGFGRGTQFAGIDKLGHVYATYVATRLLKPVFEWVGNTPEAALRLAALSAWGAMGAAELGDGFSRRYRFSPEDFAANTIGALLGYGLLSHPGWDDLVDLRLAYRPSPLSRWDPPGDYAGQRYHLVFKAEGVPAWRDVPVLRYLEFGVAYGAPGVDTPDEWRLHDFAQRRREVFVGVGLNLSRLLADLGYAGRRSGTRTQRAVESFLEVVQLPAAHYRGWNLDR